MTGDDLSMAMSHRCGRWKAMLLWLAEEKRLNEFEIRLLKEELSKNVFETDTNGLERLNNINQNQN